MCLRLDNNSDVFENLDPTLGFQNSQIQAEAEVVPSSSLVEIEVTVEVWG